MGKVKPHIFSVILAILLQSTTCDVEITENPDQAVIVTIINKDDIKIKETIDLIFTKPENSEEGFTLSQTAVIFKEGDEFPCYLDICKALLEGVALILDLSWEGWVHAENVATTLGVPYLRLDVTNRQFVQAADDFLRNRNTTDAALIFSSEAELDQGLMYLVGNTVIRIIVLNGLNSTTAMKLKNMRPTPSQYVIYGDVGKVKMMFSEARRGNLVSRDSRWTIVVEDFNSYEPTKVNGTVNLIRLKDSTCCQLLNQKSNQPCGCKDMIRDMFLNNAIQAIVDTFIKTKQTYGGAKAVKADCSGDIPESPLTEANKTFFKDLEQVLNNKYPLILVLENDVVRLRMQMSVTSLTSSEADKVQTVKMGEWTTEKRFEIDPVVANKTIKRFFKIGVIEARPFVFYNKHPNGTEFLDGFCVKLLEKLSELMSFDYRTIFPKDQRYGSKQEDGSWDGLIGDLVNGETDMIIASLTMTSEREEVVDFVAPHFDQSGISIVIRKQEKEVSLFKFMSVLEPEVWWCILGAIILTAIVLWLLDTYSPFSGRNKEKYPYKCRRFTLIESFWFALTSITPQGGGEPPKAVSGRILVAAYWLFVVLMLATFTANLAAFLTVERMQTPVSSLEELAKQSKINYTVVQSSSVYQYFHNMATAEEELYRVWKDMTLNASNDQGKYRVWDYPIKEQYNRILNIIKETGLVNSSKEGFDRVLAQKDGLFAFIDDASSIRYEVYKNCYLTEIGEPFAEQPYAIAVQSGSHLQEEISKVLLDLQKDRYFEMLYNIYWNASTRRECPNYGDTEGITLQSLGGVFIATLVGLAIGLLTLIGEIVMHKRQKKTEVKPFVKISHVSQAGPIRSTQFPRYGF